MLPTPPIITCLGKAAIIPPNLSPVKGNGMEANFDSAEQQLTSTTWDWDQFKDRGPDVKDIESRDMRTPS